MENRFVELLVTANRTAISVQLIDFAIEMQLIVVFGTRYNFRRHSAFFRSSKVLYVVESKLIMKGGNT